MENIVLGKQPDNAEGLSSRGMDKAAIAFHKCGYRNRFLSMAFVTGELL